MSECTESIDNVKRVKHILNDDVAPEHQGLTILSPADKQTGEFLSLSVSLSASRSASRSHPPEPLQ